MFYFYFKNPDIMETIYLQHWKFSLDSKGDSKWEDVIVPHDWAVSFPFSPDYSSGTGYLPGGTAWYRTVFTLREDTKQKKAFVNFDGVYKNSRVWCNGYYLGFRPSGYSGFRYDISHCVRPGENVITVKVSHEDIADSRWYTGSGIYRKAYVEIHGFSYIERDSLAVLSEYEGGAALVRVSGRVVRGGREEISAALRLEGGGELYASETGVKGTEFETCFEIPNPRLWSPESPSLYRLSVELRAGAPEGSEVSRLPPLNIGIRTIRFDPDKGFFLNHEAKARKIRGVCVHHDSGCLGAAVWPDVWRRRLEKLKAAGCNAVRMSHNPHMPELYDLCDEMGFFVMDEAFDEWEGCKNKWSRGHNVYPPVHQGYAEDFPQWHERDLADMVIRDRNHPSVILWSIGNEIDYPNDPYVHPLFEEMTGNNDSNKPRAEMLYNPDKPNMERLRVIAAELAGIVKKHDTSRPVLTAAAFPELSSRLGFFDALDMAGYNYKEHLYEADHERFPALPVLGSENGHSLKAWKAVTENEYISGQFLWTGIDYMGEAGGWPIRGSGAGLLDLAGNEKTAWFRRKALWSAEPVLYLASCPDTGAGEVQPWELLRSWDYLPGAMTRIVCYTNLAKAELFCNKKSLGMGTRDSGREYISWTIPFERGGLEALALTDSGETIVDRVESALPPVQLKLRRWKAQRAEESRTGNYKIAQIEGELLDEKGRLWVRGNPMIDVSLDGPGRLLGIENGDLSDCGEYSAPRRRMYRGRIVIYVLIPTELKEETTLTALSEGLPPAVITLV
jgi:hypothetical protein